VSGFAVAMKVAGVSRTGVHELTALLTPDLGSLLSSENS
jgi:hypothetical protein